MKKANVDFAALEAARKIDDIFAQGHHSVVQRTSKVQVVIIKAIEKIWKELINEKSV